VKRTCSIHTIIYIEIWGSPKATAAVKWTPPMEAAFDAGRTALGVAALLAHPQQDQELAMMVDASTLQQRRSPAADWQPLFFLKKNRAGTDEVFCLRSGAICLCFRYPPFPLNA
jgi:hypothetical protein